MQGDAAAHYQAALAMLSERRWAEAMEGFERAFARDRDGTLDRRPCFEWFRTPQIHEVDAFWLAELKRFLERDDVDRSHYAVAALSALRAAPAFRGWLAGGDDDAALAAVMRDELFGLLLRETVVGHSAFEIALTRLRGRLLADEPLRARAPLEFLCDLALQCFNNEYAYWNDAPEKERADALQGEVASRLAGDEAGSERLWRAVAVLGMYRPLSEIERIDRVSGGAPASLGRLLGRTVADVLEERRLGTEVRSLSAVADPTSLRVQAQYEASPYPRWFSMDRVEPMPFADWIDAEAPPGALASAPPSPSLLVAGCGTGAELVALALRLPDVRITALDLSRASLGYARRKALACGCDAVDFVQGDILNLPDLDRQFDVVYSTGVVHHMRDPAVGVRRLAERMRPGGLLKLGFYSERARAPIRAAQAAIAASEHEATPDGIRAFRRHVLGLPGDAPLRQLLRWRDFFSLSECRDMLFHVQDHDFRLPAAASMLRDAGLEVLGLSRRLPPGALQAYRARFPDDADATDLGRWDQVEASYPNLFAGMFHVWARRA